MKGLSRLEHFLLSLVFISAAFVKSAAASDLGEPSERAWVFEQTEFTLGRMQVVMAADAMRVNLVNNSVRLVSKSPEWRVVIFNTKTKLATDMSFSEYLNHIRRWSPVTEDSSNYPRKFEKIGAVNYLRQTCEQMAVLNIRSDGTVDSQKRYRLLIYVLTNENFPKQACQILGKTFAFKSINGVSLLVKQAHESGRGKIDGASFSSLLDSAFTVNTQLSTSKIEQATYPRKYFDYPKYVKKVSREIDVLAGSSDTTDGLLQMIGR